MVINVVGNLVSLMGPNKTKFNSSLQISKNVFERGRKRWLPLRALHLTGIPFAGHDMQIFRNVVAHPESVSQSPGDTVRLTRHQTNLQDNQVRPNYY